MKCRRKWPCTVCKSQVIYDGDREALTCNCGVSKVGHIPKRHMEKFVRIGHCESHLQSLGLENYLLSAKEAQVNVRQG